jgi:hypothetical protein
MLLDVGEAANISMCRARLNTTVLVFVRVQHTSKLTSESVENVTESLPETLAQLAHTRRGHCSATATCRATSGLKLLQ